MVVPLQRRLANIIHLAERTLDIQRANFNKYVSAARFLLTRAPQWIVPMWFSGQPVFWLPHGLFPYAVEWLVAVPRAPTGSVSPATWQVACSITIGLLSESIASLVASKSSAATVDARRAMARDTSASTGQEDTASGVRPVDQKQEL